MNWAWGGWPGSWTLSPEPGSGSARAETGSGQGDGFMIEVPVGPLTICRRLKEHGFAAYVVGGAVRDALLDRPPVDWDVVTDALPGQVAAAFPGSRRRDEQFGRVLVAGVDVLTMRSDGSYRDGRRPSEVTFTRHLELDLLRRDFTVNAMAYDPFTGVLIDPTGGREDLELRVVRAVGEAGERFGEDHLRALRALRLGAVLGFSLHPHTAAAIRAHATRVGLVAPERVRAELEAILLSPGVSPALEHLAAWGLLPAMLPELEPAYRQKERSTFRHCVLTAHYAPAVVELRWAGLFHDAGKVEGEGADHAASSACLAQTALERLRSPRRLIRQVVRLVEHHMFTYPEGTPAGTMRRMVLCLGPDGVRELLALRYADRQASGRPGLGEQGERALAHLRQVLVEGSAIGLSQLAIDGDDVAKALSWVPGPGIGRILELVHRRVLDDPALNQREALLQLVEELGGRPAENAGGGD
ncbi:MAG TPA: polynucleotide adenylyltransferase [Clostridiales bacterium UBA8153]|nr:polynucleotide adenylyltransferase [Clostridiales bacterium UBA8153]